MTLTLITFADLAPRISAKRDGARDRVTKAGWARLLGLTETLGGQAADDDVLSGRSWCLTRLSVQGYQGTSPSERLVVELDPTPGITVLHGANGSGKSSLADAVDTALRGGPRSPDGKVGTGGNAPLWNREHLGRDAESADIEIVLADGLDRLHVGTRIDASGSVARWARLQHDGHEREVHLGEPWLSAVNGHQPVFSYAAIERRVQVTKDLQSFLEPLLAFGGCFDAVDTELQQQADAAQQAAQLWTQAAEQSKRAVKAVDDERGTFAATALVALTWPVPGGDREAWLVQAGLDAVGSALPEIDDDLLVRCVEAAGRFDAAVAELADAEDSLRARLASPLRALAQEARERDERGSTCPVCDTHDVPWLDRLTASLSELTALDERQRQVRASMRALKQVTSSELVRLLDVLESVDLPTDLTAATARLRAAATTFVESLEAHGDQPVSAVRRSAAELLTALEGDAVVQAAAEGRRLTEHAYQWRLARRAAVRPLLDVPLERAALAAEQPEWDAAKRNLRTLQNELRGERSDVLLTATSAAVEQLLSDVGVHVTGLTVSQREARLEINDAAGQPVQLSMLSAGQRNALLLAPLLAMHGGGPFGFLVLDDPVHAFDAVRVDRLAAIVGSLARDRRVIVFTHDERLREHLLHQASHPDLRTVSRSADGVVEVEKSDLAWRLLTQDARAALILDAAHSGLGRTDVVRGLCRMAVDDACRAAVHAHTSAQGLDVMVELALLDEKSTTRSRLKHLASRYAGSAVHVRADEVLGGLDQYLDDWNRASHGNDAASQVDESEVEAAQTSCERLTAEP